MLFRVLKNILLLFLFKKFLNIIKNHSDSIDVAGIDSKAEQKLLIKFVFFAPLHQIH